jgi:hypothetical protein
MYAIRRRQAATAGYLQMRDPCFEKLDSVKQDREHLTDRIGYEVVLKIDSAVAAPPFARIPDDSTRYADNRHLGRHVSNNNRIRPNPRTRAYGNRT